MKEPLKSKLVKAHRILHMEGLAEDRFRGHITVRDEKDRIYIKRWSIGFEEVTARDLLCVDMEGKLLEGKGRLHSELPIHTEIYRRRKDIVSVIHVHPLHCVLLSSIFDGTLKIVGHSGMHFGGGIPFFDSLDLVRTKEQGIAVAEMMGDKLFVLMKNHGIVTAGRSLEEAVILAIDFEAAAKQHLMISRFQNVRQVPVEIAQKMASKLFIPEQLQMIWDYYCRKLERHRKIGKRF